MTAYEAPRITGFDVTPVNIPMRIPQRTASGAITHAPLVLLDLHTDAGVEGRAYIFTYTPIALSATAQLLRQLQPLVEGQPLAPQTLFGQLDARFRLLGNQGLVTMAIAAIDMAAWDALARWQEMPLASLLGTSPRPLPAYWSIGLEAPAEAARQGADAVERGFRVLKLKTGHAGWREDLAVMQAVRKAVGEGVGLMIDYNQSLTLPEALKRCRALDGEGLLWIEEPVLQTDWAACAELRAQVDTPLQMGENWWGVPDASRAIAAGATDLAMVDVMKLGGVTPWQRVAALAHAAGLPLSSHIFPEFSLHLLAASPGAHFVEVLETAEPALLQRCRIAEGLAHPLPGPGAGLEWDAAAVQRYRV
jgi:mandelate racemase